MHEIMIMLTELYCYKSSKGKLNFWNRIVLPLTSYGFGGSQSLNEILHYYYQKKIWAYFYPNSYAIKT